MSWRRFVAIDPGAVHNGVALFENGQCRETIEMRPWKLFLYLTATDVQGVVMEEYRLYPWKTKQQTFSTLEVVETIGVVKYICRTRGLSVVMQSAQIKIPTAAQIKARGVELRSHGHGTHCLDAELHGFYYLYRNGVTTAGRAIRP